MVNLASAAAGNDSVAVSSPRRRGKEPSGALNAKQRAALDTTSELYIRIVKRAYEGKASPRSAIKAFCLQCVGYIRKDVTNCTAEACPLYAYRPYQHGDEEEGKGECPTV